MFKDSISALIENSITEKVFPGAVACILTNKEVLYHEAFGCRSIKPKRLPMLRTTLFDLASLTKPIVIGTLCMQLVEKGRLSLSTPAEKYLPAFGQKGVTLTHLLTHTSGLPAWVPLYLRAGSREHVISYLGEVALESQPGEKAVYSCLGYIVLGALLEKVTKQPLDQLARERIFAPLGMEQTWFNPPQAWHGNCAATEDSNSFERRMVNYERYDWREGVIIGQVHDENAHFLGGVSGNAGLFATSTDLRKFCSALMDNGGVLLRLESLDTMRKVVSAEGERRCIGWAVTDDECLYHTGFTGTSIRICLKRKLAAILLTNRVHPDADRRGIIEFRRMFHEIVFSRQLSVKEGIV
ncbi:MAG: serine hydrolase [Candidatus Poribacteria bacterium]|nr:serine hydrolase [Candidatus Poribacteria bacterium]